MELVFPAIAPVALPVAGSNKLFAVQRVFCIGRNYRWQASEPPSLSMPAWFLKPAQAIVPASATLDYPPGTSDFCHEIELVVALGRGGRDLDPARIEAEHVWGYAAGLDLTRRDLQQQAKAAGGPWAPAKVFDGSAPCTPIVPASACGHPRRGKVWLRVNGEERQRADVSDLLWPVGELVALLSRSIELLPGDLVFTGTPAGVAALQPGDVLHGGVEGIADFSLTVAGASVGQTSKEHPN